MPVLAQPRCPQCLGEVPLKGLWWAARTNHFGFLIGKVGVRCSSCGAKLRVLENRVIASVIAAYLVLIASAIALGHAQLHDSHRHSGDETLPYVLIAVTALCLWQFYFARRLARLRFAQPGEALVFPLSPQPPNDEKDEDGESVESPYGDRDSSAEDDEKPQWKCRACGEDNPGTFEMCWKCQAPRSDAASN
jgi:hypothetical protein